MKTLFAVTMAVLLSLTSLFAQGGRWNEGGNGGRHGNNGRDGSGFLGNGPREPFPYFLFSDSLELTDLSGTVMVESGNRFDHYFLDTDGDGQGNYLLHFGPKNRIDSTKILPTAGDVIHLKGYVHVRENLNLFSDISEAVFVTELNGEVWFEIPELQEVSGKIIVMIPPDTCPVPGGQGMRRLDRKIPLLDTNGDNEGDYVLGIGRIPFDSLFTENQEVTIEGFEIEPRNKDRALTIPVMRVVKIDGEFLPAPKRPEMPPRDGKIGRNPEMRKKNIDSCPYPNPFNPTVNISYTLAEPGQTSVDIYNIQGRKIKRLVNEYKTAGTYEVQWDGSNQYGKKVASGTYFYIIRKDAEMDVKKIQFLK